MSKQSADMSTRHFIQDVQGLQDYIGNQLLKYSLDGAEALEKSYKQNGSDDRRDDSSLKEGPILPWKVIWI